jgi:hypothetical protein
MKWVCMLIRFGLREREREREKERDFLKRKLEFSNS